VTRGRVLDVDRLAEDEATDAGPLRGPLADRAAKSLNSLEGNG